MHSGLYRTPRVPACKDFTVHSSAEVLKVCIYQLTSTVDNSDREHLSIHPRKQTFHKSTVWKVPLFPCLKPNCILLPKVNEKQNYHILRETNYNRILYVDVHCQDYFTTLVIWTVYSWLGGRNTLSDTWTKQVLWCFQLKRHAATIFSCHCTCQLGVLPHARAEQW